MNDAIGTVRRAPVGFAHAIKVETFQLKHSWEVIDAYAPVDLVDDASVADWPVVYVPAEDWGN